jgi:Rieske Fe-S protein
MNDTPSQQPDPMPVNEGRRRLCQIAIGGMTVVAAGTVGYPVFTFLGLPKSLKPEESIEVPLSDLSDGAAFWGEKAGQQIVIVKINGQLAAFNGACPHLGCIVQWEGTTRSFKCPCHGAVFNEKGEPVAGPVNQPLRRVEFRIADGVLKIV